MVPVAVKIVGRNLPGRRYGPSANVHIGIQQGKEVGATIPADSPEAIFAFNVDAIVQEDGTVDFRGPFVHGKRGERFLYLVWGQIEPDGAFGLFGRTKLPLPALNHAHLGTFTPITPLTDKQGKLVTGTVRHPQLAWKIS